MKRILIVTMLLATPAFGAEGTASKEAAIKSTLERFDACVAKGDATCPGEFFADDATFGATYNEGKLIKGKKNIIEFVRGSGKEPGMKDVQQKRTIEYVRFVGPDHAFVDGEVNFSGGKSEGWTNWHWTALMALKDGKWVIQDARVYFVAPPPEPTPVEAQPTLAPDEPDPEPEEGEEPSAEG